MLGLFSVTNRNPNLDKRELSINVVRNYPDRQPRFTCALCSVWINPREWQIGPPDAENPRGKPFIAEAHPQFKMASEVLATKG